MTRVSLPKVTQKCPLALEFPRAGASNSSSIMDDIGTLSLHSMSTVSIIVVLHICNAPAEPSAPDA